MTTTTTEHLVFEVYGTSDSGKTKRVEVRSARDDSRLALIYWHGPWRKYVAQPQGRAIFDASCLREIADYLADLTAAHRRQKVSPEDEGSLPGSA